jgi:hypothetical protein
VLLDVILKKTELNLVNKSEKVRSIIFSTSLIKPTFVPELVPKQPHSIFKPLPRLITIAKMKTTSITEMIKEFSFTDIPNNKNIPATTSIHGNVIAKKLTNERGSNS